MKIMREKHGYKSTESNSKSATGSHCSVPGQTPTECDSVDKNNNNNNNYDNNNNNKDNNDNNNNNNNLFHMGNTDKYKI